MSRRVTLHGVQAGPHDGLSGSIVVYVAVGVEPGHPPKERALVPVHGDDFLMRRAGQGPVDEDEAEVGPQPGDDGTALQLKDLGVDAAAVEAEDAGEVAGGRVRHGHGVVSVGCADVRGVSE